MRRIWYRPKGRFRPMRISVSAVFFEPFREQSSEGTPLFGQEAPLAETTGLSLCLRRIEGRAQNPLIGLRQRPPKFAEPTSSFREELLQSAVGTFTITATIDQLPAEQLYKKRVSTSPFLDYGLRAARKHGIGSPGKFFGGFGLDQSQPAEFKAVNER